MILIEILTAPGCAYCEMAKSRVASTIQKVGMNVLDLSVKVVDVVAHPEIGLKYEIRSTPAIAINGQLVFIGLPREEDLKAKIAGALALER
jgi:thioredoxin 1